MEVDPATRAAELALAEEIERSWYAHPRPSEKPQDGPVRLFIPCPDGVALLTLNRARGRIHYRTWAKETAAWRHRAAEIAGEALGRRLVGPVTVVAKPVQPTASLADAGAHMPTLKAIVDGLVDVGWLEGDGPAHVAAVVMVAPIKARPDPVGMVIELVPVGAGLVVA